MLSNTHLIGGMAFATTSIFLSDFLKIKIDNESLFFVSCCIGSIIPDLDHKKSWISKISLFPFWKILNPKDNQLNHRSTLTHKLLPIFWFIGYGFCRISLFENIYKDLFIGLLVGTSSHYILDKLYSKTKKNQFESWSEKPSFYLNWIIFIVTLILCMI